MNRVLLVDDSRFIRNHFRGWLERAGFEVLEAGNGAEGLKVLRDQGADCLVLDLVMPCMGGLSVLKSLRELDGTPPVLVLTADIQQGTADEVNALGATKVLHKPSGAAELIEAVREVLSDREPIA